MKKSTGPDLLDIASRRNIAFFFCEGKKREEEFSKESMNELCCNGENSRD